MNLLNVCSNVLGMKPDPLAGIDVESLDLAECAELLKRIATAIERKHGAVAAPYLRRAALHVAEARAEGAEARAMSRGASCGRSRLTR